MSNDFLFPTRAAEEAAIARYGAQAARRASKAVKGLRDMPAVDIYDECRDHAYDILRAAGGEALVDHLLEDVTEVGVSTVMG